MRFEAFVAIRYLRGKRKNRFVSIITLISVAGVSVGVIALIVVMSVMTGFDHALRSTIIGNRSHLSILSASRKPITDPDATIQRIEALCPEILASGPFIELLCMLKTTSEGGIQNYEGAYIQGVDVERETHVTEIADNLTTKNGRTFGMGSLPGEQEVMLGYILAERLGISVGDRVAVITPNNKGTPLGMRPGQMMWLRVSGIGQAQMSEYDTAYGFVDLDTAMRLKGQQGVDGVHCRLTNPDLAALVARRIEERLGYNAITWYESQQPFFEALVQEKVVMFIILAFIVMVAAFNITSSLIMVVMEKRRDIGILRTIGVSSGSVLRLFVLEGLYIGISGTLVGTLLGMLFALYLNPIAEYIAWGIGVDLFNSQIYYFDRIPVPGGLRHFWVASGGNWTLIREGVHGFLQVMWRDVALTALSAVVLTFLSTLYPAWSAARIDPVDALRYE